MLHYEPTYFSKKGHKLAIILPSPSTDTDLHDKPLLGAATSILPAVLAQLGLPKESCHIIYLLNKPSRFFNEKSRQVLQSFDGTKQLLSKLKINCCLLVGEDMLRLFGENRSMLKMHGSIFPSFECNNIKCIGTFAPSVVMRIYERITPFKIDINKAINQSLFPEIRRMERKLITMPSFNLICKKLEQVIENKSDVALDLEGHPNAIGVTCYSVATSPHDCFIVPFRDIAHNPLWSVEEEMTLWRLTSKLLNDPDIGKTAQNATYELFVFHYSHGICLQGLKDDTMLKQWELYCELPKGLDYLTAFYTDEPYYKDERTIKNLETHHEYCCKDSAYTLEINQKQEKVLQTYDKSAEHYQFNLNVLRPYTYMQLRGSKIDEDLRQQHLKNTWDKIEQQQEILNDLTNSYINVKSSKQMKELLYDKYKMKKQYSGFGKNKTVTADANALAQLYADTENPVIIELLKQMRLRTRFSDINKLQPFEDGRIRCNYSLVGNDDVTLATGRISSSATWLYRDINRPFIEFKTYSENKVKKQKMVLNHKLTNKPLGTNLQNVTKELRDLFIPDTPEHSFYQYDLSGADAWTVAADLCALGYPQMLDHLKNGIKPSVVITLLTKYGQDVYSWDLPTLKKYHNQFLKDVKTDPLLAQAYTCAKACQHGTNYGMQSKLMTAILLKRSMTGYVDAVNNGKTDADFQVNLTHPNTMARYQRLYSDYYGLEARNQWLTREICNKGYIDSASGARRVFMSLRSRKKIDAATLRAAASHEPQANTTYATNSALWNMYSDPDNRNKNGSLKVEPTLMVHDALGGQALKSHIPDATEKMFQWFDIPLIIHGINIKIPVEGGWGDNWKQTD